MTREEWWALYCLRFGPETVTKSDWLEGEKEFMEAVAKDLGFKGEWTLGDVINVFRQIRHAEVWRRQQPAK